MLLELAAVIGILSLDSKTNADRIANRVLKKQAEAEIAEAVELQLASFEDDIHRTYGLQNLTAKQFAELMDTYYLEFAFRDFITKAEFYRQNLRRHNT